MRTKLVASALALLTFVLFVPPLFAGESSPAVKLATAPKYPILTLAGRVYGKVTVRVTIVARSRGECRAAMEIRGRRCPGACGDAEIQLCNSAAEFKGAGANAEPAKPAGHFQDFSDFAGCFGWDPWRANDALLRMTTRCNVMEQRPTLVS
jgi:hypothetical protein